jgi:DNA-binding transcriptional LysR family regulator
MTLKQLEALYWSSVLGSFALAADRLSMTQSALSKRVQELEAEVGVQLFDRSGPRARITEVGQEVFAKAEQILRLRDELLMSAGGPRRVKGACRFGISELMAMQWLPQLVSRVRSEYPDVIVEPHVALTQELLDDVVQGDSDFAICPGGSQDPELASELISNVELYWVGSPSLFSKKDIVTLESIQSHPIVSMSSQAGSTMLLQSFAQERGLKFRRILASNSPDAVAAVTIAGLGIALLAGPYVERFIREGKLCRLRVEERLKVPRLSYYVHWRIDNSRMLARVVREIAVQLCKGDCGSGDH